jgi:glucosamine 6-phosphate synthetase-like amidotransferase/phosphosugar isomerase protein
MCGVFGYVSKGGRGPDADILVRLARVTESRGQDAHGWAWADANGALGQYKAPGPITQSDALDRLVEHTRSAVAVIAHTRWATHGDAAVNDNNHPHRVADGYYVHNGIIANYLELIRKHGLKPKTECDTEVLGLLMTARKFKTGKRTNRWRQVLTQAEHSGRLVTLCLWKEQLIAARSGDGNPLHTGEDDRGKYLASLGEGLPGTVMYVKPNYMLTWTRNGQVYKQGASVKLPVVIRPAKKNWFSKSAYYQEYSAGGNAVSYPRTTSERERSQAELWDLIDKQEY